VPETLYKGELAERNRLTADEIRALFFGHRLHGRTVWTSSEHAASITPDGVVTASGDWGTINGDIAEFEGDRLCFKSTYVRRCIMILRIPGGTKAKENEYLWISGGREFTFSQVE
jgi:adenylate cyclase